MGCTTLGLLLKRDDRDRVAVQEFKQLGNHHPDPFLLVCISTRHIVYLAFHISTMESRFKAVTPPAKRPKRLATTSKTLCQSCCPT